MVTYKNLIDKVNFEIVWKEYIIFYPDMAHLKDKFIQIFNALLLQESKENIEEMVIHIDRQDYEELSDEEESRLALSDKEIEGIGYRVHGKNNSFEWNGYWDLSAADWGSWIGYYIDDKVFKFFKIEQIVALCLFEMTWHGLSESEVIGWANKIH